MPGGDGKLSVNTNFYYINQVPSVTDVDAPQNLAASNIQTETAMLTWKPPRADISGYILSFESADGMVKVSEPHKYIYLGLKTQRCLLHGLSNASVLIVVCAWFSSLGSGGCPKPHSNILQHVSADCLHRIHSQIAGHCWAKEKQDHFYCLHHQ